MLSCSVQQPFPLTSLPIYCQRLIPFNRSHSQKLASLALALSIPKNMAVFKRPWSTKIGI